MEQDAQYVRELREQWQVAHENVHVLEKEARTLAVEDINRRLEDMNQFRAQLNKERGDYLLRHDYEREHSALADRVKELEIARGEQSGKAAAYASLAGLVGIGAGIVLHFWK